MPRDTSSVSDQSFQISPEANRITPTARPVYTDSRLFAELRSDVGPTHALALGRALLSDRAGPMHVSSRKPANMPIGFLVSPVHLDSTELTLQGNLAALQLDETPSAGRLASPESVLLIGPPAVLRKQVIVERPTSNSQTDEPHLQDVLDEGVIGALRRAVRGALSRFEDDTWQLRSMSLSFDRPLVMGILNVTPDSFFDGGRHMRLDDAVRRAVEIQELGADILDIGGESTRPGADSADLREEMSRVEPVLQAVASEIDIPISIDTTKPEVARMGLEHGAEIINDVSAGRFDPEILQVAAKAGTGLILMHMLGTPRTMQDDPSYTDVVGEVLQFLCARVACAESAGVSHSHIAVDPGIGFGKRLSDNLALIRESRQLRATGCPVLIGPSRKSFIGRLLNLGADERLEGTLASLCVGIMSGASIVRVHDVRAARRCVDMAVSWSEWSNRSEVT